MRVSEQLALINEPPRVSEKYNVVGIQGLDTRALTKHLRNYGAQMGIISTADLNPESLLKKVKAHPGIAAFDLVKDVTTKEQYKWNEGCLEMAAC